MPHRTEAEVIAKILLAEFRIIIQRIMLIKHLAYKILTSSASYSINEVKPSFL